jgi:hypothetical protein
MPKDYLKLTCSWRSRVQTLGEFVDAARAYLVALKPLHPIFRGPLYLLGSSSKEFEQLDEDFSNLESFVLRNGWSREAPKNWFTNVQSDGTLCLESTSPEVGFDLTLVSSKKDKKGDGILITIRGGKSGVAFNGVGGGISFSFPDVNAAEFEQLPFVKLLMKVSVECYQPDRANVTGYEFYKAQAVDAATVNSIGWLYYFADATVNGAIPSDVSREPFGPSGTLITLQAHRPLPQDAEAVAKAKRIWQAIPRYWFTYDEPHASIM